MRRRLFNLVVTLSLLLWVSVLVLWVRSYCRADSVSWRTYRGGNYDGFSRNPWVRSNRGGLIFSVNDKAFHYNGGPPSEEGPWPPSWVSHPADAQLGLDKAAAVRSPFGVNLAGFGFGRYHSRSSTVDGWAVYRQTIVAVPHWFPLLVLSVPLALRVRRAVVARQARRRVRANRCGRCGYDVRTSAGRCPECGEPVPDCPEGTGRVAPPCITSEGREAT